MNHANRSTVVGGGDMKRVTSGAVRIGHQRLARRSACNSRSAQCSPVSTGTASRQEHGGALTGSGRVDRIETGTKETAVFVCSWSVLVG